MVLAETVASVAKRVSRLPTSFSALSPAPAAPHRSAEVKFEIDSSLEGTGFELLVRGRVKLVVGRRRQRN
jgi:hypothetical protein